MWLFKGMAVGMFLIGIGISAVAWNSGERGLQVFIWPFVLGGAMLVAAIFSPLLYPEASQRPALFKFPQRKGALSPSEPFAAEDLGPELFRCRRLPLLTYTTNQGALFINLVMMPFLLLPALAAIAAVMPPAALIIVNSLLGHSADDLKNSWWWHDLIGAGFVIAYAAGLWFIYFSPLRDRLVVYRDGFKLRCNYKNVAVRFRDLLEINFGRELKNAPEGAPRKVAREGMFVLNSAINLLLRSGNTVTIKAFLRRFEQRDLERFLDYVEEQHPALFIERAYLTEAPGGPEFIITESRWKARQPGVPHPRGVPEAPTEQLRGVLPVIRERSPMGFSSNANRTAAILVACAAIVLSMAIIGEVIDGIDSGEVWTSSKSTPSRLADREDDAADFWIVIFLHLAMGASIGYVGIAEFLYRREQKAAPKSIGLVARAIPEGNCPKCRGDLQAHENLRHCVYCGSNQLDAASSSAPARCRACGRYLKAASKADGHFAGRICFCGHCGFMLSKIT